MSLIEQQRRLRDHLLANRAEPVTGVPAACAPGLAVYRNNYRGQLNACLKETFEKTWSWIGDGAFNDAVECYIDEAPPRSWTLSDYGSGFEAHLRNAYPHDLEVGELAWLEWTLRRAFDGPNAEAVAMEALGEVDWEHAVLGLVPTLAVGAVSTNCAAIYTALAEETAPPAAELLPSPAWIRVWRAGLTPRYCTIDALEHAALALVLAGQSFGEVCERLAEDDDPTAVERFGAVLARWLEDGLVRSVLS